MHVHCFFKFHSVSHFVDSLAPKRCSLKESANIFLAYKANYTVQQLMKQSQAV